MDVNIERAADFLMVARQDANIVFFDELGLLGGKVGPNRESKVIVILGFPDISEKCDYELRPAWANWLANHLKRFKVRFYPRFGNKRIERATSVSFEKDGRPAFAIHWGMYFTIQSYDRYWHPIGWRRVDKWFRK